MVDVENDINFFRKDESLSIDELKASAEVYGFPTLLYPNRLRDGILKTSDAVYTFPIVEIMHFTDSFIKESIAWLI